MATGIGETLRAARRAQGRSLSDAAAETRVRETYLAALEEEEFAALGGGVYVKGFLASYARFLGLDPEPLLEAYRAEYEAGDEQFMLSEQRPVAMGPRDRHSGPAVIVVSAGVLLLVLAGIGLLLDGGDEPPPQERAPSPVPSESPAEGETLAPVEPTPTDDPTEAPVEIEGVEVALTVTGTVSWMRVEVDGETLIEGTRDNGYTETFVGDERVVLRIGDASAVSIEANGADQGSLGAPNAVVLVTCSQGETDCDVEVVA